MSERRFGFESSGYMDMTYICPKCEGTGEGSEEELDFDEYDPGECHLCKGKGQVHFQTYMRFVKQEEDGSKI